MQPIQTALCSFGMSGWVFHAPFIDKHPAFEMYAVLERTKNLAVEKYPEVKTFRSLDDMLADERIELVVVNTPNITHFDFTKKALQAGKHVLVEKPFTVTTHEADELIALAKENNKLLSVYQNRRWDSDFKTVKKVIAEGSLGDVVEAEIHFDRYSTGLSPKAHKEEAVKGTGIVYDLGAHLIDQALQLFGIPDAVFADTAAMRSLSQVDDYFELLLFYDKLRVRLKGSLLVKEPVPAYVIHGTSGSFLKQRGDVQESNLQQLKSLSDDDWGREPAALQGILHNDTAKMTIDTEQGNYMDLYDGLAKAIREGAPLPVTAEEGRNVIHIIEAAYQSVAEKKRITINPQ